MRCRASDETRAVNFVRQELLRYFKTLKTMKAAQEFPVSCAMFIIEELDDEYHDQNARKSRELFQVQDVGQVEGIL